MNELPRVIYSIMQTAQVVLTEDNGIVTLVPIAEKKDSQIDKTARFSGIFTDGKISAEKFIDRKAEEKELDL